MERNDFDLKKPFIDFLSKQKSELEQLVIYFIKIEKDTPEDLQWRLLEESPFDLKISTLINNQRILPSEIIRTMLETVDEYLIALKKFNSDQFAAFLMGMGLKVLPYQYWGTQKLSEFLGKLRDAHGHAKRIENETPRDQKWRLEEDLSLKFSSYQKSHKNMPSENLDISISMIESMLKSFKKNSFN